MARSVLVVDDMPDVADGVAELCSIWGHQATVAYEGAAALALFETLRPDTVIVDHVLPDMDGFEVARRLRAAAGGPLCLIALSGDPLEPDGVFDHYLMKPLDFDQLQRLLDAAD